MADLGWVDGPFTNNLLLVSHQFCATLFRDHISEIEGLWLSLLEKTEKKGTVLSDY